MVCDNLVDERKLTVHKRKLQYTGIFSFKSYIYILYYDRSQTVTINIMIVVSIPTDIEGMNNFIVLALIKSVATRYLDDSAGTRKWVME